MKRRATLLLAIAAAVLLAYAGGNLLQAPWMSSSARAVATRGALLDAEKANIEIFEKVSPSVVQVVAQSSANPFSEEQEGGVASGTGIVWDGDGHVVTNNHVVEKASRLAVRFASGEVVRAEIVGTAPNYDLAVLRVQSAHALPPPVAVGSSADLKVGQFAFAIGNPFGLDQSMSSGIISALKRKLPTSSGREIANVIQTDTAINPGNSGGPLLDSAGRLIGVTSAILSPSGSNAGIGFAIPVDIVNRVVPGLIRDGRVPTPGVGVVTANEAVATRLGAEGLIVVRTTPGSPAERAGIHGVDFSTGHLGDVITAVDGKPVHRLSDLTDEVEQVGVGKTVRLSVKRDGSTRDVEVAVVDIGRTQ
ncbi:trypsin-like peptidase domain-containing protein [Bradyrhizobium jicamae]|uniref:Trypsin-like peptidase domain-containing protein n=1 Tax=Bradyrhizobium jicamae TaxID=280332 RepID=A0ABS5FSF9_9BRAD|nr:trypsin-like peptidase domain-containing protein [Bradyrhizobium jicamae]MBR0799709.1 trypsin-like peptidase domain-containing protein [Bradyrhizobium jicamae]MBR0933112.1 trypsin-like peptidase domain-containing protein [Bradyrhizobium jicamae]